MTLKLHMSKVYDRVKWIFFGEVDEVDGFQREVDWFNDDLY